MGFAVLHYDKQTGSSPGLSQHIERGCYRDGEWVEWHPLNADASRAHLNRELISGELSRDERIAKRIKDAGIKTPRKDQVRALTLIMSASCEDMDRIMKEGKFEAWCASSIRWAQETHGEDNVVSAVLHMDEKTPHLHVTVVPIVQGISKDRAYREKKAKEAEENGIEQKKKRKYKKKDPRANRLCAADVMARTRLKEYQTTYAAAVGQYGLERGVDGSLAKHVDINDWYKSLVTEVQQLEAQKSVLKAEIGGLEASRAIVLAKVEGAAKNTAKGVGEAIASVGKGVGKMLTEMGTYAIPSKARDREKAAEKKAEEATEREKIAKSKQHDAEAERDLMRKQLYSAINEKNNFISKYGREIREVDSLNATISNLRLTNDQLHGLIKDSAELGLSAVQTHDLAQGRELQVPVITLKGTDTPITPANGEFFRLRFNKQLQILKDNLWQPIKSWLTYARRELREWIRQNETPRKSRGRGM